MNRIKIEKQLFDQYGTELFKIYHKGHILPLENIQKGIAVSDIDHMWLEDYPYLSYPIFTQEPPVDEISHFFNEEKRFMVFASPVHVSEKEVKLGAYGLNQLFYYTPFDEKGGRGKMYQLFGAEMNDIINELNEVLAA